MNNPSIKQAAISVSNNSRLTMETFAKILTKIDDEEKADLYRWLQLVKSKQQMLESKAKKFTRIR
jgi:hypothetical protein